MMRLSTIILILLSAVPVFAVDYPAHREVYVNDFADVLSDNEESALRDALTNLRTQKDIEMTVVSIQTMRDYGYNSDNYERFSTGLFNDWGVGDKVKNNGVMILLSTGDRFARIELGSGYGRDMNARVQAIFDHDMKPLLKRGDFGEGLMAGAKGMLVEIQKPEVNAPLSLWQKIKNAPQMVILPVFIGFFGFSVAKGTRTGRALLNGLGTAISSRRSLKCSNCSGRMARLSSFDKMPELNKEQQDEERLGGCQWDVFKCGRCGKVETARVKKWFSDVKPCPKCARISLQTGEENLQNMRKVTVRCGGCGYSHFNTYSYYGSSGGGGGGSGGGSFGGGSSSGGGGGGRF